MASISKTFHMTLFADIQVGLAEKLLMASVLLLPLSTLIPIEDTDSSMPKEVKVLLFTWLLCLAFSSGQQAKSAGSKKTAGARTKQKAPAKAKPSVRSPMSDRLCALMVECERKDPEKTIEAFQQATLEGIPLDRRAWNAVMCANQHLGRADDAISAFEKMVEHCSPNAKTYGALIGACANDKRYPEAVHYYQIMLQKGFTANRFTYHDVICSYLVMNMFGDALAVYEETKKNAVIPSGCTFKLLVRACKRRRLDSMALQFEEELTQAKKIDKDLCDLYLAKADNPQEMSMKADASMLKKESTKTPGMELDEVSTTDVLDSHDLEPSTLITHCLVQGPLSGKHDLESE